MSFLINPYVFGGLVELARDTSFYETSGAGSTVTTDARTIGAASATREVYALIYSSTAAANRTISSVTIGGVSATVHIQATDGGSFNSRCAIASATVPTGTTAVVVVTYSGSVDRAAVGVISLDGLVSTTPHDTTSGTNANPVTSGATFDTPSGGYAMAIAGSASGVENLTPSSAWTGILTEYLDDYVVVPGEPPDVFNNPYTTAFLSPTTAVTGDTLTVTFTNATGGGQVLAALSVR